MSFYEVRFTWILSNILGVAFASHVISEWQVQKIWHITLLYAAFIVYDITFVFASDVMVTVAK
jgi:hypothetical protein